MKKVVLKKSCIILVLSLMIVAGITMTNASFKTKTNELNNSFLIANISTEVDEEKPKPEGNVIAKKPIIKNNSAEAVNVRARLTLSPQALVDKLNISVRIVDGWTYNKADGYYYSTIPAGGQIALYDQVQGNVVTADGKMNPELDGLEIGLYYEVVPTYYYDEDGNKQDKNVWEFYDNLKK